jgi:histone H3/H4
MSDNENVVIGSKVKAVIKEKGLMCSGELPGAVSDKVRAMIEAACERATANKRSTVRPHDL